MTSAHVFFIPGMILIGMIVGFIFGARAARNQMDIQAKRDAEREAARAARAAKRASSSDKPDKPDETPAEAKTPEAESAKDEKPADEPKQAKGGKKR